MEDIKHEKAVLQEYGRGSPHSSREDVRRVDEFTRAEQRKIVHKIDRRLVVLVGLMYCVSLMDRTNLSNAAIAGLSKQLQLYKGFRYNIVTLVFFPPYIVFQIPSTVVVRWLGPRLHLGTITLLWGGIMIAMGFVRDWKTMAGMRVLLGLLEAGFFPSCVYLLSTWYTRYDMGRRYSLFYMLGCVASAFAGILAYGLIQMNGIQGIRGWCWIFIIEGVITCALGILGYILLVGFPDSNKRYWGFLNEREVKWVIETVNADRGDAHVEPFNIVKYLKGGLDWKVWCYAMLFFDTTTIAYALAYFGPIIFQEELHFSMAMSQCGGAPCFVFAAIVMYCTSWIGDKYKTRGPIVVFNMLMTLIGLPILGWAKSPAVKYFSMFLITAGVNSNVPAVMTYQANNIRGQWKRAFCSGLLVGFGGIGGIAGGLVFRNKDKPHYHPGIWACIACCLLNLVLVAVLTVSFKRQNRLADQGKITIEESEEGFRYTI